MSMFAGIPAMTRAMELAREVMDDETKDEEIMSAFAFYLFAVSCLAGGLFTVISRHPVHSVLWLILAFLSSAGLFVLLGAEFVAMLLVIVYVGAVAVLFLFVVMMLDVDFAELKAEMARYMPLALLIAVVILMQFAIAYGAWESSAMASDVARSSRSRARCTTRRRWGSILYDQLLPALPARGPHPAGRDDRGDRADAAPPLGREAAGRAGADVCAIPRPRWSCATSSPGRAFDLPHLLPLAGRHPAAVVAGAALFWAVKALVGYWLWGLWRGRRAR